MKIFGYEILIKKIINKTSPQDGECWLDSRKYLSGCPNKVIVNSAGVNIVVYSKGD